MKCHKTIKQSWANSLLIVGVLAVGVAHQADGRADVTANQVSMLVTYQAQGKTQGKKVQRKKEDNTPENILVKAERLGTEHSEAKQRICNYIKQSINSLHNFLDKNNKESAKRHFGYMRQDLATLDNVIKSLEEHLAHEDIQLLHADLVALQKELVHLVQVLEDHIHLPVIFLGPKIGCFKYLLPSDVNKKGIIELGSCISHRKKC